MQVTRVMTFFLTLPLIATAVLPEAGIESSIAVKEIEKVGSAAETRMRRAVFDLIPTTSGDRRREKVRWCREGRKCGATQKSHRGSFASYRKFIGRHSKGQRRSRRKLKKLFMDWLKEERAKVKVKEEDKMH